MAGTVKQIEKELDAWARAYRDTAAMYAQRTEPENAAHAANLMNVATCLESASKALGFGNVGAAYDELESVCDKRSIDTTGADHQPLNALLDRLGQVLELVYDI